MRIFILKYSVRLIYHHDIILKIIKSAFFLYELETGLDRSQVHRVDDPGMDRVFFKNLAVDFLVIAFLCPEAVVYSSGPIL
jgi:hypothetical protein